MLNTVFHWFLANPRRICVLGTWLYLIGTVTLFLALINGAEPLHLTAGALLAWCGGWAMETGRNYVRRRWLSLRRAVVEIESATVTPPVNTPPVN